MNSSKIVSPKYAQALQRELVAVLAASCIVLCLAAWQFFRAYLQAFAVLRKVAGDPAPWVARATDGAPVAIQDFTFTVASPDGQQQVRARRFSTARDKARNIAIASKPRSQIRRRQRHLEMRHGMHQPDSRSARRSMKASQASNWLAAIHSSG